MYSCSMKQLPNCQIYVNELRVIGQIWSWESLVKPEHPVTRFNPMMGYTILVGADVRKHDFSSYHHTIWHLGKP